jgi:hypothetical protein
VSKTGLARFDNDRYSLDARAFGYPVEICAYAERIKSWQDGKVICQYDRAFGGNRDIFDPLHYIPVLVRKPGALRNGAPLKEWDLPPAIKRVQSKLGEVPTAERQMVQMLSMVPTDGPGAVEAACPEALKDGAPAAAFVLNILARHREPRTSLTIATSDALRLT